MPKKYLIIGASAAGIGAINALRRLDPQGEIICISSESELPYNKCLLADYVAGIKPQEELYIFTQRQAQEKSVTLLLGSTVQKINPEHHSLDLSDGRSMPYDRLLIATGSHPIMPAIVGISQADSIFTFHRLSDADKILQAINDKHKKPTSVVIIGGGLSGLECADALVPHNVAITVVEKNSHILTGLVTPEGAALIGRSLRAKNVDLIVDDQVVEIQRTTSQPIGAKLASGRFIAADIIVVAVGVRPTIDLAQKAGVQIINNGIIVDEYMRTSAPDIYAAGDCVVVKDTISGAMINSCLWPDAMLQGMIAAHAMTGNDKKYPGAALIISSSFFGLKFASCGPIANPPEGYEVIINKQADFHHTFLMQGGVLKGFCLVGNTTSFAALKRAVLTGQSMAKELLVQAFDS